MFLKEDIEELEEFEHLEHEEALKNNCAEPVVCYTIRCLCDTSARRTTDVPEMKL